jgi:hypothetical protein
MKTRKERVTVPSFKENPFKVEGIKEVCRNANKDETTAVDTKTGELLSIRTVKSLTTYVDTARFTKVFDNSLDEVIKHFTLTEWKLWFYIFKQLVPNKDEVYIDMDECCNFMEWKGYNNYYIGIRGLIEKNMLVKSVKGNSTYWINTNMFFNGDRLKIN